VVEQLIDRICRLFAVTMVLCLASMVVMVFGNVVLRYGFNSGITVSEELSRWLFVWMTYLGALIALRNRAHLGTDALVSRLPLAGRKLCFVVAHLLMLAVCWLMLVGGWKQTVINARTTSAVMEAPLAWLYASGVVFALLAAIVIAHQLWQLVTGRPAAADLIGATDSEGR
jgi:TRAP-type transport system small permease protein